MHARTHTQLFFLLPSTKLNWEAEEWSAEATSSSISLHNRKIKIGRTFPPGARSGQPNRTTLHLVTPRSSGTKGWSHLPWKPPAPNSPPGDGRVRATPPAGRGLRSHDLPPRPFHRAPHFAVRGEHPRLHLVLRNPGDPSSRPTVFRTRPRRLPEATHGESTMNFPPALPPSEDCPVSPGACGAEPQRALRVARKKKGTRAHSKLTRSQAANFWAAARNARRPELSRSAEPSRRGCPGCNPPRVSPVAPQALRSPSIYTPAQLPATGALTQSHPATDRRERIQLSRAVYGSAAVPAGTWGGEAGARHPAGVPPSLAAHPKSFYLRQAAFRTQHRRGVEGRLCASGLSRGRVPVSRGRGRPTRRAAGGPFRGPGHRKPQLLSGFQLARLSAPALL